MRKTILLFAVALLSVSVFSQDLETIIKKYSKASGIEAMEKFKTTKVVASTSTQGMNIAMKMYEKKPDKFRMEADMMGAQIITVINGDKGWTLNPMMGTEPVALSLDDLKSAESQKIFGDNLSSQFKEGKIELVGETEFDGKKAYKLKVETEAGDAYSFVDKKEYLILGVEMEMTQQGQTFSTVIKMKDYKDVKGYKMAHKMVTSVMGQTVVVEFTEVEFDVAIEDSLFELK